MSKFPLPVSLLSFLISHLLIPGLCSTTFTIVNKCEYTVWPAILSNAGVPPLSTTGFTLHNGECKSITPPASWGGRFWGRTHCTQDNSTGEFTCLTGDCGTNKLECSGNGATPPATLVEFTLDGNGGLDFFDVSLVDGYNLPVLVAPQGGTGENCTSTGCEADLNSACPSALKVTNADDSGNIACNSACNALKQPQYCCSGAYDSPQLCKPSSYSKVFKSACPHAYSYAYDDGTSTFTCANADYIITFCPSPNTSQKSSSSPDETPESSSTPVVDNNITMVYEGALDASDATSWSTLRVHMLASNSIAALIAVHVSTRWFSHII